MSHELDEKVARAMGWVCVDLKATYKWRRPGSPALCQTVNPWSTDYECVPEMLAWLRSRFTLTEIGVYKDGEVWARGSFDDVDTIDMESPGDTIPEALSRLVVAVAEAKEAGQ